MMAYHASKAALKMLTMCMVAEWAQYHINDNHSTTLRPFDFAQGRLCSGQGLGHCAIGPRVPRTYCFSQPLWGNPDLLRGSSVPFPRAVSLSLRRLWGRSSF